MLNRQAPVSASILYRKILTEIKRQDLTGYALAKKTGLPISTMHRFLDAQGSPTLATVETVINALGLRLEIREKL